MHVDDFLHLVMDVRKKVRLMNYVEVSVAIERNLVTVQSFVTGLTRVPWPSTLSAILDYIVKSDSAAESKTVRTVTCSQQRSRPSKPRFVRPIRRSVVRRMKKKA